MKPRVQIIALGGTIACTPDSAGSGVAPGLTGADLVAAVPQLAALADVEAQRALIAQKTIRAPFDGVLGIRKVNLGQFISPGTAIVSLQQLDPIFVNFAYPDAEAERLRDALAARAARDDDHDDA